MRRFPRMARFLYIKKLTLSLDLVVVAKRHRTSKRRKKWRKVTQERRNFAERDGRVWGLEGLRRCTLDLFG